MFPTNQIGLLVAACMVLFTALGLTDGQSAVVFSAVKTTDLPEYTDEDLPVVYDVIDTNVTGAFDGRTFIAPVQGLYLFTFSVKSYDTLVNLDVNGMYRRGAQMTHVDSNNPENMASNSIMLLLKEGDEVRMYRVRFYEEIINSSPEPGLYTSFSGALLFEPTSPRLYAFSVGRTIEEYNPILEDTALDFDITDAHIGGGFDGTTFHVPVTGLYLFAFACSGSEMAVHLKVNGVIKRSIITYEQYVDIDSDENVAENTILLILQAGDEVTLERSPWGAYISIMDDGIGNSFSGALLYELTSYGIQTPSSACFHDTEDPKITLAQTAIAFSAAKTVDMAPVLTDTPIEFNLIETSIGSAFDGTTFTAPIQGYYLFTFSAKAIRMAVHLKVNGVTRRSAIGDVEQSSDNMVGNSAILFLAQDDKVTLDLSPYATYGLDNTHPTKGIFTAFNGVLLYEIP